MNRIMSQESKWSVHQPQMPMNPSQSSYLPNMSAPLNHTLPTPMNNGPEQSNYFDSIQYQEPPSHSSQNYPSAQSQDQNQPPQQQQHTPQQHPLFLAPVPQKPEALDNYRQPFSSYLPVSSLSNPPKSLNDSPKPKPFLTPQEKSSSFPHMPYQPPHFHSTPPFSSSIRRRRAETYSFGPDQGPFFSQTTKQFYPVWNIERSLSLKIRINSKVDRGFFLADNDWTCYRRNYFQISSAFSMLGPNQTTCYDPESPSLIEIDGNFYKINQFHLCISAKVSNSEKKIELVQHTPKRDKGPQTIPQHKIIRPGGNLSLNTMGSSQSIVTFERIQFKTATANNGKRRAAQQYYVLFVELFADIEGVQERYKIAHLQSAQLVVRGRSPGHYADNNHHVERFNPIAIPASHDDRYMNHSPYRPPTHHVHNDLPFHPSSQYPNYPSYSNQNLMINSSTPSSYQQSVPFNQTPPSSMMPSNPPHLPHSYPPNPPHPSYSQNGMLPPSQPNYGPQPPHHPFMVHHVNEMSPSESSSPDMFSNEVQTPDPNDVSGFAPPGNPPKMNPHPLGITDSWK